MATKEEIREWLEACGVGKDGGYMIAVHSATALPQLRFTPSDNTAFKPLHLLNPSLTGVQGPTFAEWKKAKGREGKILKIMDAYNEDSLYGHMGPAMAAKILDAIEGGGK